MKRFFFLLWIAFFSWSSIAFGAECPANKAIYTSSDGSTIFKTTQFAVKRALFCNYFDKDNEPERGGANFQFWLPKEGFFNTMMPDYDDLKIEEEPHKIECRESKTVMLKGKVNDETVYLWNERLLALPCCMTFSLSERDFEKHLERRGFSDNFIWLQDELVPNAKHEIDTISNQNYHPDYKQPLGNDVLGITGCKQNETLYGDKYLNVSKRKAIKYASYYEEEEGTIKEPDGGMSNGMKVGHWRYYDNAGALWTEGFYKNGKKDGLWNTYETDGSIGETATWVDGLKGESFTEIVPDGWYVNGALLSHRCFEDFGLHNQEQNYLEAIAKTFKISDAADFASNPGKYFGAKIDYKKGEEESLIVRVEDCLAPSITEIEESGSIVEYIPYDDDSRPLAHYYYLIRSYNSAPCQLIAPNVQSECLASFFLTRGEDTGGTIGHERTTGIYGLFDLEEMGLSIIPLKWTDRNEGLNFIDDTNF